MKWVPEGRLNTAKALVSAYSPSTVPLAITFFFGGGGLVLVIHIVVQVWRRDSQRRLGRPGESLEVDEVQISNRESSHLGPQDGLVDWGWAG